MHEIYGILMPLMPELSALQGMYVTPGMQEIYVHQLLRNASNSSLAYYLLLHVPADTHSDCSLCCFTKRAAQMCMHFTRGIHVVP